MGSRRCPPTVAEPRMWPLRRLIDGADLTLSRRRNGRCGSFGTFTRFRHSRAGIDRRRWADTADRVPLAGDLFPQLLDGAPVGALAKTGVKERQRLVAI